MNGLVYVLQSSVGTVSTGRFLSGRVSLHSEPLNMLQNSPQFNVLHKFHIVVSGREEVS